MSDQIVASSTKHLLEIVDQLQDKGVSFKVLNIDLDTSTPTGKLMLTMLGTIATFEREMMLDRQAEGIAIAKTEKIHTLTPILSRLCRDLTIKYVRINPSFYN